MLYCQREREKKKRPNKRSLLFREDKYGRGKIVLMKSFPDDLGRLFASFWKSNELGEGGQEEDPEMVVTRVESMDYILNPGLMGQVLY